ncbi:MAG: hypothetical protein D6722_23550 [Bacteroidetes bacterium]|nr:MAG: hypothetical protein D6722_23550 [Bacteroidota bacterium]
MPFSAEIDLLSRYEHFIHARVERTLLGPRAEFSLTLRPAGPGGRPGQPLVMRVGGISPFAEVEAQLEAWVGQRLDSVEPLQVRGSDLQLRLSHSQGSVELVFFCKNLSVIDPYEQYP